MYLTSPFQKYKILVTEKSLSMGPGCDQLLEASSAMVDDPLQVYEIDIEK